MANQGADVCTQSGLTKRSAAKLMSWQAICAAHSRWLQGPVMKKSHLSGALLRPELSAAAAPDPVHAQQRPAAAQKLQPPANLPVSAHKSLRALMDACKSAWLTIELMTRAVARYGLTTKPSWSVYSPKCTTQDITHDPSRALLSNKEGLPIVLLGYLSRASPCRQMQCNAWPHVSNKDALK